MLLALSTEIFSISVSCFSLSLAYLSFNKRPRKFEVMNNIVCKYECDNQYSTKFYKFLVIYLNMLHSLYELNYKSASKFSLNTEYIQLPSITPSLITLFESSASSLNPAFSSALREPIFLVKGSA